MSEAILCPQVGQDLTLAKVVALHVKLGDSVKKGDIVAEVESEKASFEVEAFSNGTVVELPYKVGDTATVLEPLVVLGKAGEKPTAAKVAPTAGKKESAVTITKATHAPVLNADGGVRSSPLARRMAQSAGVDVATIAGTGPQGAVVQRDVETYAKKTPTNSNVANLANVAGSLNFKNLTQGTGMPVVFIHGFGAELSAWRLLSTVVKFPNPMLALDLPGHGASAEVSNPNFATLVESVAATLKAQGQTAFHLVGHSLGAAISIALSARSEFKVKSLTLISPAGLGPSINGDFIAGFLGAKSEAALTVQMQRLVHDPKSLLPAMVRATQAAREGTDLAAKQGRVAAGLFEGSTQLFSVKHELAAYAGPARVILGRRDTVISAEETEVAIPGHVALHRLENVGHLATLEAQDLVSRLITETVRSGE